MKDVVEVVEVVAVRLVTLRISDAENGFAARSELYVRLRISWATETMGSGSVCQQMLTWSRKRCCQLTHKTCGGLICVRTVFRCASLQILDTAPTPIAVRTLILHRGRLSVAPGTVLPARPTQSVVAGTTVVLVQVLCMSTNAHGWWAWELEVWA
jgi:hypothetical protein